ncbi:hypothetical protein QR680_011947 [Steinernema hermaphroditum]|uniref:Uncharacterized protein n=1 Tax=Steinernema hermaphroditum TaxID=289476 RepID=A0AA39I0C8_9BILA|nr:hypothetical protein QR680_011947 [Steinernema hermaphroditum]
MNALGHSLTSVTVAWDPKQLAVHTSQLVAVITKTIYDNEISPAVVTHLDAALKTLDFPNESIHIHWHQETSKAFTKDLELRGKDSSLKSSKEGGVWQLAAPQPENKVKSGTAYKALEATRPTTVYPCVQALLICPPTRASHPNEPPKPKDLQLRLAIMEQHLATLIIDVVNLAPELEDYINKKAARNPHQAFIGTRTEPGRGPWISKRALIDATRYVMAPRLRNPAGWISAIAEEIREWAENPPLSATRRQELYEELAKTKGSPIVIGKNGRDGTPTAKGEQPLSSQAPGRR